MTIEKYVPTRQDVIRIDMIDAPRELKRGEGLYRWRHDAKDFYLDLLGVRAELREVGVERVDNILDRLQNFKKVYVNLRTKEVST